MATFSARDHIVTGRGTIIARALQFIIARMYLNDASQYYIDNADCGTHSHCSWLSGLWTCLPTFPWTCAEHVHRMLIPQLSSPSSQLTTNL